MRNPFEVLIPLLAAGLLTASTQAQDHPKPTAQAPATPTPKGPVLESGEGFAVGLSDGSVQVFGEGRREGPMGSLAELVWMDLEESEWESRMLLFKCTGKIKDELCGPPKGHGRVDLAKALQVDCHHAFQAWVQLSGALWKEAYGTGAARVRLVEAFGPFLGKRLPQGNDLPELTAAWIGQGDLLRTSPEAFARWLADPAQESLLDKARRNLNHFFSDSSWWFQTGTAPVLGDPATTTTWVAGGDGARVFVLSLPPGKNRIEALARLKAILGLPKK